MSNTAHSYLYFAYGSNMLSRRLQAADRAPTAVPRGPGVLHGYRLTFDKAGRDGSGKCHIETCRQSSVWGVLYEVPWAEKAGVDAAESLGSGYREALVPVTTEHGVVSAVTYIALVRKPDLLPFHWYKSLVVAGASEHALPGEYIAWLCSCASQPDPHAARQARYEAMLGTSALSLRADGKSS